VKLDLIRDLIKIFALVTMTIDHVGYTLFPDLTILRIIGRLAFPLFAYLIALGLNSTKKPKKYLLTLLIFGFISQLPYFLVFNIQPFERLNIFFSLFLGALTIKYFKKRSLLAFAPIFLSLILNTEGSFYVVFTVLFMNLLLDDKKIGIISLFALNLPFLFGDFQGLALVALPIILLHQESRLKIEINITANSILYSLRKYFFYIYYPLHLTLLFLIVSNFF